MWNSGCFDSVLFDERSSCRLLRRDGNNGTVKVLRPIARQFCENVVNLPRDRFVRIAHVGELHLSSDAPS